MDSYVDAGNMDPSQLFVHSDLYDYPTPEASSPSSETFNSNESEEPRKKKRKAWGQPVPEIKQILPPRKRAKTAEEKEQRKNERILRNRKAADKSRQRQKAAVADLERHVKEIEQRLNYYESRFGPIPDFKFDPSLDPSPSTYSAENNSVASPFDLDVKHEMETPAPSHHSDIIDRSTATPVLSAGTPAPSYYQESPALAPVLNLGDNASMDLSSSDNSSGLTQCPAVALCDLQCQPEILSQKLRSLQPQHQVSTVLTFLHYMTILKSFSTSMLSPMSLIFQILAETLSATSTQLDTIVSNNFQLIHILISMPMTSTRPAVFRLRLLSRLLACNPSLAQTLETAADRALQQKVSEENWNENPDHRWAVASLMTIKWSIRWLEREHLKIRMQARLGILSNDKLTEQVGEEEFSGVDYGAVSRHIRQWDAIDPKPCIHVLPGTKMEVMSSHASVEVH